MAKILVLGANGMLGRVVYNYLRRNLKNSVWGTARNDKTFFPFEALEAESSYLRITKKIGAIDYIINCIGILKNYKNSGQASNAVDYIQINSLLPQLLSQLGEKDGFKLIHISTDAVFPSLVGAVSEVHQASSGDMYGCSKLLGEPSSSACLTIRTSILGFDPIHNRGILEWVKGDSDAVITGFINQRWAGCTVLQFAKLCHFLVLQNKMTKVLNKTSILHFAPIGPTTKYHIISSLIKIMELKKELKQGRGERVTRVLYSAYNFVDLNSYERTLDTALRELIVFERLLN